jgi:hypothetical protein
LKLNGTHQILIYADDVNIFGVNVLVIKSTESLVVTSKGIRLEVNTGKTEYLVISRSECVTKSQNECW